MHDDDWFTFAELAGRLGSLVWVEKELGELLVTWSKIEAQPSVAVALFATGRHHQWHSELIESCLPTSPQLQEPVLVTPPTPGWAEAIALLNEQIAPSATSARLRSLIKVINPWLERETAALRDLARPISDAAILRWLRFVELDHFDDGSAMAQLLTSVESTTVHMEDHVLLSQLNLAQ